MVRGTGLVLSCSWWWKMVVFGDSWWLMVGGVAIVAVSREVLPT